MTTKTADNRDTMVHTFTVREEDGERVYTGHVSSRRPNSIVVLLTQPYNVAGRVVKIQTCDVVSETEAA